MRFPTSRKCTRSGKVAGLLALSSALFSTVTAADPCKSIYDKLEQDGDVSGYFPAKMAYDCLKALPLNDEYAKQTADGLLPIHELISYQTYFKKPPTPELEIPVHDGVAEIKKIQDNLKKGHYKGLYDFATDVYKVFMNYRDGHTQLNPLVNYVFKYAHPYSIVSVADSPTAMPKVWTLNEERKLDKEVTKINGEPVADYLVALANSTLDHFGFTDPDTRYNMLFAQFPTVAAEDEHEHMGYFQYVDQYPGADKFTFTYTDGSTEEVEWSARLADATFAPYLKGGAKELASTLWVSDEHWTEMTRRWTEEEAIQHATQAGWKIVNELNLTSSDEENKSTHRKLPKHHGSGVPKNGHHTSAKQHHPNFSSAGHYRPNGGVRGSPHKRDVEAMKKMFRKLRKRSDDDDEEVEDDDAEYEVEDDDAEYEVEDDVYDVEDDYVEDDGPNPPKPTSTPETTDDTTTTDDDTNTDDTNTDDTNTDDTTTTDDTNTDDTNTDDTNTDDTNTTSGSDPGFPEYFNTTSNGNFRFYSLDGETAVLDVSSFSADWREDKLEASDLLDYGLEYVAATGHKYLIIDLTNNGGGAAFLPFDFTRMLFPQKYIFHTVNMRFTKAGYVMLKNHDLGAYWTVEGKDWTSLEELYTPVERDGDKFTQMFKYDHLQLTAEGGYGEDPTQQQAFPKENIVVLGNGYCGSACFAWLESLHRQGVRSYAMGGRPNGSKYMQTSGGVKGGILFSIEKFTILRQFYGAFDDEQAQKLAKILPGPLRLTLIYNGLNVENLFRNGEEDQLPLEFRYTPACKRFSWTKEMMVDTGYTWKFIREQAWDKHGKPTGCEKEYVPEKPYKPHETTEDTKKGHHQTHAGSRIPPHAPPKQQKHGGADVIPIHPKHGSGRPKQTHPEGKEHKKGEWKPPSMPYPDYKPITGSHHRAKGHASTKQGGQHHKPGEEHYKGRFKNGDTRGL